MRIVRVDPHEPAEADLREAAATLLRGGLVAFPTETVYGLGADALDPDAVRRIFAAKGRPAFNPLIAHVHDVDAALRLTAGFPPAARRLAAAFWPGPLTLVLPRSPAVPDVVTAGLPTVAVRVPAHPVARALLEAVGRPLAAPSANRYTAVSPTTAAHVAKSLGSRVDLILDGGPTRVGIESTVLDLSTGQPLLLRPGSIPVPDLEAVAGPIRRSEAVRGEAPRPAPGMVARHYSPEADMLLFGLGEREEIARTVEMAVERGTRVGALLLGPPPAPVTHAVEMPQAPEAYARELYSALHDLDRLGCGLIVVEDVPLGPAWEGVRDRLSRAAQRD